MNAHSCAGPSRTVVTDRRERSQPKRHAAQALCSPISNVADIANANVDAAIGTIHNGSSVNACNAIIAQPMRRDGCSEMSTIDRPLTSDSGAVSHHTLFGLVNVTSAARAPSRYRSPCPD